MHAAACCANARRQEASLLEAMQQKLDSHLRDPDAPTAPKTLSLFISDPAMPFFLGATAAALAQAPACSDECAAAPAHTRSPPASRVVEPLSERECTPRNVGTRRQLSPQTAAAVSSAMGPRIVPMLCPRPCRRQRAHYGLPRVAVRGRNASRENSLFNICVFVGSDYHMVFSSPIGILTPGCPDVT
eukprot:4151370-Pleurochrysis_carterae.AAC.5